MQRIFILILSLGIYKLKTHSKISFIHSFDSSDGLVVSTDFIRFRLTMAYGIGRNIALWFWINEQIFSDIGIVSEINTNLWTLL